MVTGVKLSAITLDVYFDELYGDFGDICRMTYDAVIRLDSGDEFTVPINMAIRHCEDGKEVLCYYPFDKTIDVDSVESITIGDVVIHVK